MPTLYAENVGMHQGSVPEVEAKDLDSLEGRVLP